jgi:hypothetical protein
MEDLLYLTSPTPLFYLLSIGFRVRRRLSEINENSIFFYLSRLKLIQKTDTYLKIKKIKMRHIADYLQLMKEFVAQLTGIYTKCLTTNQISGKYTLQSIHYVLVFKN